MPPPPFLYIPPPPFFSSYIPIYSSNHPARMPPPQFNDKRKVRRLIEELGIPYSYICCNSIASWPYYDNTHPSEVLPPLDHFQIYGDGNVKAYFVAGSDIGKLTIKAADDVRTLNKIVHFRPKCNFLNINELASLWEKKIGRTLPRVIVSENDLLAAAQETVIPRSINCCSFHPRYFHKGMPNKFPDRWTK